MGISRLEIGSRRFVGKKIISLNCYLANSISGEELSIDTLVAVLNFETMLPYLLAPAGGTALLTSDNKLLAVGPSVPVRFTSTEEFVYGQEVRYYYDDVLIGLFYLSSIKRVSKTNYELSCISAMGLLDNTQHYGGIYTGQNMTAVLQDIIGGVVPYTVDRELNNIRVYGWLPVATRRSNLHQLLFAEGACVKKNANGSLFISVIRGETPAAIHDDRLFSDGSFDYGAPATSVRVTEHSYAAYNSDETKTLFDGEAASDPLVSPAGVSRRGTLVLFSEPMHDLVISNGTILESGVNYAVLGPSTNCVLTGKAYTHTARVVTRTSGNAVASKENEKTVDAATLVSMVNSENVADRVMAYYGRAKIITNDLVVARERPGDAVSLKDPFDDQASGFLQSLDITMSNILRASAKIVTDYTPVPPGNFYTNYSTFTASQNWTVPSSCNGKIRVVLISGGQGGASGYQGKPGSNGSVGAFGDPGMGGAGGPGGNGGKILIVTLNVNPGDIVSLHIGLGGAGGVSEGGDPILGAAGGATTVTVGGVTYTSNDGFVSDTGYTNLLNGARYAFPGSDGFEGGRGCIGKGLNSDGYWTWEYYSTGFANQMWHGGAGGDSRRLYLDTTLVALMSGGLGGGPALGSDGNRGGNGGLFFASVSGQGEVLDETMYYSGGNGGKGADALLSGTTMITPGCGGCGGHGGGGGGGGAEVLVASGRTIRPFGVLGGGQGGKGGVGGDGAPGCAIIYY